MKSELEVYVLNVAAILQQPVGEYLNLFSAARQRAILRYRFNADRNRTIWAELLIRHVLSKKFSAPVEIGRDESGKPYVVGRAVEISLTHSGNWVACSFGSEPNGVDIETDTTDALEIAEHFFTAAEFETLNALTGAARRLQFLKFWTLKESCFKCTGGTDFENNIAGRNFVLADGAVLGVAGNKFCLPEKYITATIFSPNGQNL